VEKELDAAFSDARVQIIPGHGGIFEVKLDDRLIYTKSDTGCFPDAGEITGIIRNSI
jgi:selT/selW/selH-like putative selenoprotein